MLGQCSGASHLDLFGSRLTLACKDTVCGWMARVEMGHWKGKLVQLRML